MSNPSAENKPPEPARCWNCWAVGHTHKFCNSRALSADQREEIRMRLRIPLPQPPSVYINFLKAERCYNCWALSDHMDKNCPKPQLSVPEREALRIKLNVPVPPFWRNILAKEDIRQMGEEMDRREEMAFMADQLEGEGEGVQILEQEDDGVEKSELVQNGVEAMNIAGSDLFFLRLKQIFAERVAREQGLIGDSQDSGDIINQARGVIGATGPSAIDLFQEKFRQAGELKLAQEKEKQGKLDTPNKEEDTSTPNNNNNNRPTGFLPPHLRWKKKDTGSEASTPVKEEEPNTPQKLIHTPTPAIKEPEKTDNMGFDDLINLEDSPEVGKKLPALLQTPSAFWDLHELTPGAVEPLLKPYNEGTPTPTPNETQIRYNITRDSIMEDDSADYGAVGGAVYESILERMEAYEKAKQLKQVQEMKKQGNLLDMDVEEEIKQEDLSIIQEETVKPVECEEVEEPQYGDTDDGGEVLHFVLDNPLAASSIPDDEQTGLMAVKEESALLISDGDGSSTAKKMLEKDISDDEVNELNERFGGPNFTSGLGNRHHHHGKDLGITPEVNREITEVDYLKGLVSEMEHRHTGMDRSLRELVHVVKKALPEVAALKQLPTNNNNNTNLVATNGNYNQLLEQINNRLVTLEYNQSAASSVLNTVMQQCQSRLEFLEGRQNNNPSPNDLLDMINHLNTRLDSLEVDKQIPLPPTSPDGRGDSVARGWIFPEDNNTNLAGSGMGGGHHRREREHKRRSHKQRAMSPPEDIRPNTARDRNASVAPQQQHKAGGSQQIGHGGHGHQHQRHHHHQSQRNGGGGHAGPAQGAQVHTHAHDRGHHHIPGNVRTQSNVHTQPNAHTHERARERHHHMQGNVPPENQVDIGMRPHHQGQAAKWSNMDVHRREEILDERHAERRGKAPKRRVKQSRTTPE